MEDQIVEKEEKLTDILNKWQARPNFLIEILQDIQEEYHYLPEEILKITSKELDVPLSQIFHIATFFKGLSLKPRGKHLVQVCVGTACHVQGSAKILDNYEARLNIKAGESTKDLKYALEAVRCLGCCGLAAVVTVNKDLYGQVRLSESDKILKNTNNLGG
ncbi:MAG: NAD(P)H-dependent oxidoreductase subunit E [Bacteroidetes bacterium]|nr:NAD(P)H-dependent oxidoreductase subunit E [Bacteroidota bacterium]